MTENTSSGKHAAHEENTAADGLRANLRDAGQALLAAGSSLGSLLSKQAGKYAEDLPGKLKAATASARERLDSASDESEVRAAASNFVAEAEKQFQAFQKRDLELSDEVMATLRSTVEDVRGTFNSKIDELRAKDTDGVLEDVRQRLEDLFGRVQEQFAGKEETPDIIEGEIVAEDGK